MFQNVFYQCASLELQPAFVLTTKATPLTSRHNDAGYLVMLRHSSA